MSSANSDSDNFTVANVRRMLAAESRQLADEPWPPMTKVTRSDGTTVEVNVPTLLRLHADTLEELLDCLTAISEYEPTEVMKDDFAYDRMVESYRTAARNGLEGSS